MYATLYVMYNAATILLWIWAGGLKFNKSILSWVELGCRKHVLAICTDSNHSIKNKLFSFSSPEQSSGWAFVILECTSSVVRRSLCVVNNFVVTTLQPIILIQSSSNLLRMFILKISRTSLNMGWVGSKSRSLGQIFVKSCYHSRGHNFEPIFIKLA